MKLSRKYLIVLCFISIVGFGIASDCFCLHTNNQNVTPLASAFEGLCDKIEEFKNALTQICPKPDAFPLKEIPKSLTTLIEDLKRYTTTNDVHDGNLYDHSAWVEQVVTKWFSSENSDEKSWIEGISNNRFRNLLALSGFLHDIGKGGNNTTSYFTVVNHEKIGYENLMVNPTNSYTLANATKFDFDTLFKDLLIEAEERNIIAVLVGIHYSFGMVLAGSKTYDDFLKELKKLSTNLKPSPKINELLVRMAIAIGAADVCGFKDPKTTQSRIFGNALTTKSKSNVKTPYWEQWNFNTIGLSKRKELIQHYKNNKNKYSANTPLLQFPYFDWQPLGNKVYLS